ncbi:ChaN family lipoprotein [Lentibacter algarum]|uniref:ChaN family lipoprotein n=1 Tax=Lentibacter algarum TaxID=576131 RepID=UPI001C0882BB|nr:ChaN family lipoprotein [Lentibacter algarum]MBU2982640.1 ChaN family lipoprotein [Lentibacter algarum]
MKYLTILLAFAATAPSAENFPQADVVLLGELHDNPHHHATQAEWVSGLAPKALVFEMFSTEAAEGVSADIRHDKAALLTQLDWWGRASEEAEMYWPIIEAAPDAKLYGSLLDRPAMQAAMKAGVAETFGAEAATYGLDLALPEAEQEAREADQLAAHCDAMPAEMLPVLVSLQRLRDAALARSVAQAFEETGGPIAVITGNGHARKDRGLAVYLARVKPDLTVFSLGQIEDGRSTEGVFDKVVSAPVAEREDPCLAFKKD